MKTSKMFSSWKSELAKIHVGNYGGSKYGLCRTVFEKK